MRRITATAAARAFGDLLGLVEHGQSVQILRHGRAVARMSPDVDFMSGRQAAALFRGQRADPAAAAAVAAQLARLKEEEDHALSR
jgi:antitoxin (DNA-binding transcriptional repressor) of toxin-antitoxin stability system